MNKNMQTLVGLEPGVRENVFSLNSTALVYSKLEKK